MTTPDRQPIEGVIVDDEIGIERFCEGLIEGNTEFDWRPDTPHSLPEWLRDDLRRWARQFIAWDRAEREGRR